MTTRTLNSRMDGMMCQMCIMCCGMSKMENGRVLLLYYPA